MQIAHAAPGPWFVVVDEPDCVSLAGKKTLKNLRDDEFIDCNSAANARLIAAAPELLGALEKLIAWDETGYPVSEDCFSLARAAVAKAKG